MLVLLLPGRLLLLEYPVDFLFHKRLCCCSDRICCTLNRADNVAIKFNTLFRGRDTLKVAVPDVREICLGFLELGVTFFVFVAFRYLVAPGIANAVVVCFLGPFHVALLDGDGRGMFCRGRG